MRVYWRKAYGAWSFGVVFARATGCDYFVVGVHLGHRDLYCQWPAKGIYAESEVAQ
jgi:hypothetical protein